jgi:hypothetical protein
LTAPHSCITSSGAAAVTVGDTSIPRGRMTSPSISATRDRFARAEGELKASPMARTRKPKVPEP